MKIPLSNIFDVVEPRLYRCRILGYVGSHSLMFIEVSRILSELDETFYLGFEEVLYFEGPTIWQNVDFHLGTGNEISRIVELLYKGTIKDLTKYRESLLDRYSLFVLESSDTRVRILAANAYKAIDGPIFSYEPPRKPSNIIRIVPPAI